MAEKLEKNLNEEQASKLAKAAEKEKAEKEQKEKLEALAKEKADKEKEKEPKLSKPPATQPKPILHASKLKPRDLTENELYLFAKNRAKFENIYSLSNSIESDFLAAIKKGAISKNHNIVVQSYLELVTYQIKHAVLFIESSNIDMVKDGQNLFQQGISNLCGLVGYIESLGVKGNEYNKTVSEKIVDVRAKLEDSLKHIEGKLNNFTIYPSLNCSKTNLENTLNETNLALRTLVYHTTQLKYSLLAFNNTQTTIENSGNNKVCPLNK